MGDLEALSIQPDGFLIEDGLFSPTSISPLLSNPSPESISGECWEQAEETTKEIIKQIQPTVVSEQRRKAVIEYLQCLIKSSLSGEVYPFGSVPLKTYLPDGDIDLTALSVQQAEDTLANGVRVVLEREEQRNDADFEVKDVQYINAEVKLIKCLVQNIVVDISFNQLGGLCTLCFLEQVDRLIGKNHLFKRSIILIKAWCYYESRILGAHHGLISTYALETMVLYIFHLFHSSLDGPLAVLYRFLEYYSKFDWDNFCISLNGPVSISSLPEIVAETPDNDGGELLLDKEFLGNCIEQFSVPSRGLDADSRSFPQKHFNIVDPLKENNNLGRSVSKGNFYRIRSAFTYGARKLGQILLLTAEDIADELNKFFTNTLDRHGSGQRPDVQVSVPTSNAILSDPAPSKSVEKCTGTRTVLNSPSVSSSGTAGDSRSCPEELLQEGTSNINLSGSHRKSSTGLGKEPQRCTTGMGSSLEVLERFGYIKEIGISGGRLVGDAEDRTSSRMPGPLVTISSSECIPHSCEPVTSPIGGAHHAPHLYLSPPHRENGNIENQMLSKLSQGTAGEMDTVVQKDSEASKLGTDHEKDSCEEGSVAVVKIDGPSVSSLLDPVDASASTTGSVGTPNSLSDLSGDYYSHLNSLLCAQWCHGFPISGQYLPMPVPSPFQSNHAFDTLHRPMQLMPNVFPHVNANAVFPRTHLYPMHATISGSAFGVEDPSQATKRGIGTYFPNMFQGERIPSGRTVPPVPHGQFGRPYRGSSYFGEKGSHVPPQEQYSSLHIRPKPVVPPGFYQDNHPMSRGSSHPNGFTLPTEKVEFGSFGQMASGAPSPEVSKQPVYGTHSQGNSSHLSTVTTPRPRPVSGVNVEGSKREAYQLERETDFPPLSVPVAQSSK